MDRHLIHPKLLSDLGLEEAEVEPALAEVVTDGGQALGIRNR